MCFRYFILLICTLLVNISAIKAQVNYEVDDTINGEAVDMPVGVFVTGEDLNTNLVVDSLLDEESVNLSYEDSIIIARLAAIPTTIEMPLNNVTRRYIQNYSRRYNPSVSAMLASIDFYSPIFEEALERYELPLELKYLPVIESALRPTATSRVGAAGLWQFMPATGRRYGLLINTLVDERRDPIKSSEAAAHYLSDLYNMFGDWGLAIAAYNCGERNIMKAIIRSGNPENPDFWTIYNYLPHETRGYVPAFIAANYIMTYYYEHGIEPRESTLPDEVDTVLVLADIHLDRVASVCNMDINDLKILNPQYRRNIVPASNTLCLPVDAVEPYLNYENTVYSGNISGLRRTVVADLPQYEPSKSRYRKGRKGRRGSSSGSKSVTARKGDSLSAIARRSGTTVAQLKKLNGMKGDKIRSGQKIRVK